MLLPLPVLLPLVLLPATPLAGPIMPVGEPARTTGTTPAPRGVPARGVVPAQESGMLDSGPT
eukprot:1158533-Pelagomonas_calceolata.AAC.18